MFDVIATTPLSITGVQVAFGTATLADSVEVWAKPGTYVGSEGVAADWTLVGSGATSASAQDVPTPVIFLSTPITLATGGQIGLYIRFSGAGRVSYTDGDQSGTLEAVDQNLLIFEGVGVAGSFGATTGNRIPNVTVHYTLTDLAAPTVSVIGANRIRTTEKRQRIDGIASDDVGIASVKVRFKRQRNNGTTRNVTRFLPFDPATGLFRINVRTFVGRNPVRFTVTDTAGKASPVAKAVIIRKE